MKSSTHEITLVIITYNSSNQIRKLLKSIDNSTNSKLLSKIIIIENNSPDKKITQDLIRKYQSKNSLKIKFLLSKNNNGFAKSCNIGAKLASSKYVLFLNPDTELTRNSLQTILSHAKYTRADFIGGKSVTHDGRIHKTVVRYPGLLTGLFEFANLGKIFRISAGHRYFYYEDLDIYNSNTDIEVEALGGVFILAKLDSFNLISGFDERFFMYLEDVDLGFRAREAGLKVIFCPHSIIEHIGGASSTNKHHIRHQAWYDSRRIYFKKHFGMIVNCIIQPIFIIEEFALKLREKYS